VTHRVTVSFRDPFHIWGTTDAAHSFSCSPPGLRWRQAEDLAAVLLGLPWHAASAIENTINHAQYANWVDNGRTAMLIMKFGDLLVWLASMVSMR